MDIRDSALRALSTRNRSKKELRDFLSSKGFCNEDIEEVITDFEDVGYVSDRDYAAQFIRYGFRKGWGKSRIFRELAKRGVDYFISQDAYDDYVEECMDEDSFGGLFDTMETECREQDRAMAVAKKMCIGESFDEGEVSEKLKGKIARRLGSYGYDSSVIYKVINNLNKMESFDEEL